MTFCDCNGHHDTVESARKKFQDLLHCFMQQGDDAESRQMVFDSAIALAPSHDDAVAALHRLIDKGAHRALRCDAIYSLRTRAIHAHNVAALRLLCSTDIDWSGRCVDADLTAENKHICVAESRSSVVVETNGETSWLSPIHHPLFDALVCYALRCTSRTRLCTIPGGAPRAYYQMFHITLKATLRDRSPFVAAQALLVIVMRMGGFNLAECFVNFGFIFCCFHVPQSVWLALYDELYRIALVLCDTTMIGGCLDIFAFGVLRAIVCGFAASALNKERIVTLNRLCVDWPAHCKAQRGFDAAMARIVSRDLSECALNDVRILYFGSPFQWGFRARHRLHTVAPLQYARLLNVALALAPLHLPVYVVLEIVQWLPCICLHNWAILTVDFALAPHQQVALLRAVFNWHRDKVQKRAIV